MSNFKAFFLFLVRIATAPFTHWPLIKGLVILAMVVGLSLAVGGWSLLKILTASPMDTLWVRVLSILGVLASIVVLNLTLGVQDKRTRRRWRVEMSQMLTFYRAFGQYPPEEQDVDGRKAMLPFVLAVLKDRAQSYLTWSTTYAEMQVAAGKAMEMMMEIPIQPADKRNLGLALQRLESAKRLFRSPQNAAQHFLFRLPHDVRGILNSKPEGINVDAPAKK